MEKKKLKTNTRGGATFLNKDAQDKNRFKKAVKLFVLLLFIVLVIGMSYGYVTKIIESTKQNKLVAGILDLELFEGEEVIIENLYPQANEVGLIQEESFDFKLINKTANDTNYILKLQKIETPDELALTDVVYGLTKDNKSSTNLLSEMEDGIIDEGTIKGNQTINYELRFWLREDIEDDVATNNKTLKYRLSLDASQAFSFNDLFKNRADTSTTIDFTKSSSATNGRGIYKYTEDGEDIYYWRGKVEDNHVVFAGFCWEAVRTTKTGGLKMIYDGVVGNDGSCTNTGEDSQIESISYFNSSYNSPAYNGYMYGNIIYQRHSKTLNSTELTTEGILYGNDVEWDGNNYTLREDDIFVSTGVWSEDYDDIGNAHHYTCFNNEGTCDIIYYIYNTDSGNANYIILNDGKTVEIAWKEMHQNDQSSRIKTTIETWFEGTDLVKEKNLEKIEDAVYCNDRSVQDGNWGGWIKDGNATTATLYYSSYNRMVDGNPNLSCNVNDAFTVSLLNGNGKLVWPVGMLTADEIIMAGGQRSLVTDFYLYTGQLYWGLTPYVFNYYSAHVFNINDVGYLNTFSVSGMLNVRPVLSLSSTVEFSSGTGTETDPYVVN